MPKALLDFINADISKLKIGSKLYVKELEDEKFTLLHPDNTVVVQVRIARAAIVEAVIEGEEVEGETEEGEAETEASTEEGKAQE